MIKLEEISYNRGFMMKKNDCDGLIFDKIGVMQWFFIKENLSEKIIIIIRDLYD